MKTNISYCVKCIIPDTRPGIKIYTDGICSACKSHERKGVETDWEVRREAFTTLVSQVKKLNRDYDCVIPVSGGKDSTWQVVKCLEYGLHPLAITWRSPSRNEVGARNLENLISLGVDHIDFSINPHVEKKFMLVSLVEAGDCAIPMHMAIFNIPPMMALKMNIPLIIWGENPAEEYSGQYKDLLGHRLDEKWFKKFGVTQGTTALNWESSELSAEELTPYFGPTDEQLSAGGIKGVFLGYYFDWDPENSLEMAELNGFERSSKGPKTGFYNYADIDEDFISIHHYLKWYKFGFTRSYDNLSLEIRNGRLRRDEAVQWLLDRGDETPHEDIVKFCDFVGLTKHEFYEVIEQHRNPNIWKIVDNKWMIEGFLIPDWRWI